MEKEKDVMAVKQDEEQQRSHLKVVEAIKEKELRIDELVREVADLKSKLQQTSNAHNVGAKSSSLESAKLKQAQPQIAP